MSFSSLGLSQFLVDAAAKEQYLQPYPIQIQAIPAILSGKDVLGIAQTGSGKTASFVWPILQLLQNKNSIQNRHVLALVLVPTRELAVQVGDVFTLFAKAAPQRIKTMAVFGGVSINPQMINMQGVAILVATPGRLLDLVDAKAVSLSSVQILVLDEADKMLNLGFQAEMEAIFKLLPLKRQNLLFSATLAKEVVNITELILKDAITIEIDTEAGNENIDLISQKAYSAEDERKGPVLRYLIKQHNMKQVLVFTSSIHKADAVVAKLRINKIAAEAIHSKKSQGARVEALRNFKSGRLQVLVATDIMSRGIDIPFLPFVINYELPRSPKDYIHRIGRTGRAESPGEAISLVSKAEQHHFEVIQKKMKKVVLLQETESIDLKGF
ncbi:MAG: DEAD/DEAH box helicase [Cytophagales bacterium]